MVHVSGALSDRPLDAAGSHLLQALTWSDGWRRGDLGSIFSTYHLLRLLLSGGTDVGLHSKGVLDMLQKGKEAVPLTVVDIKAPSSFVCTTVRFLCCLPAPHPSPVLSP